MKLHILRSVEARARGVIGKDAIGDDELFVFPDTYEGMEFHMQTVPFDIKIAFLDCDYGILAIDHMAAHTGRACAPHKSVMAIEAAPDYFERHGLKADDVSVWEAIANRAMRGEL